MTPERFREIAASDPERANAMVTTAMGWLPSRDCHGKLWCWERGRSEVSRSTPPPYLTAAGPDRWKWWGELIEAVFALDFDVCMERDNLDAPREYCIAHYGYDAQVNDSLPLALGCALAAAGMIEVAERPEGSKP